MTNQRWFRAVRISVAIFFLTGFLIIFSDVRGKLPSFIYELFTSFQFLPSLLKFLVMPKVLAAGFLIIILLTILTGRLYCSFLCPLGIMQDAIAYIRRVLPFKQKRRKYRKALNMVRYPILVISALSLLFTGILAINVLDPYANFSRIASNLYQPVFISVYNLISKMLMNMGIYAIQPFMEKVIHPLPFFFGLSVFLLILILVLYRDRLYCNSICPVGSLLGLISKFSLFKLKIETNSCVSCGKCHLVCKANCINVKTQTIDETMCISCFNCIAVCEGRSIGLTNSWKKKRRIEPTTDNTRRNLLKTGLLALGSIPMWANASKEETETSDFYERGPISPPGSISHEHLKDKCIACHLCVSACPTKVLQPSCMEYGFTGMMLPLMMNRIAFCNYECTKCSEVCPTGAMVPLTVEKKKATQIGKVFLNIDLCVVKTKEKSCGSCSEHCPTQAVYMVPYKDHLTIPETNPDICVGCGACEHVCPVEVPHVAIYVLPNRIHKEALKPVTEKVVVKEMEEFPF